MEAHVNWLIRTGWKNKTKPLFKHPRVNWKLEKVDMAWPSRQQIIFQLTRGVGKSDQADQARAAAKPVIWKNTKQVFEAVRSVEIGCIGQSSGGENPGRQTIQWLPEKLLLRKQRLMRKASPSL